MLLVLSLCLLPSVCVGATTMPHYYAHDAVLDKNGVIAPWYKGQNGQLDFRIRVAGGTIKRYPWVDAGKAPTVGPIYLYTQRWHINRDGDLTVKTERCTEWENGDVGQRAYILIDGLVDYYKYTGDPMAIGHIACYADYLLDHCQTNADHPWPNFLISVPLKGKLFGKADPAGLIQLDMAAGVGNALLRAYQLTGNTRWLEAAKHWGDVFAEKCNLTPGQRPWGRYANPENIPKNGGWWGDDTNKMTGGIVMVLRFLDRLIELGYTGKGDAIVKARDAGRAYFRDTLLPVWSVKDTWGRHYWDFVHDTRGMVSMNDAANYMMDHKDVFPNWRNDVRNIVALFLNACSVNTDSNSDTFSGAWQMPESDVCCFRSTSYGSVTLAVALSRYGVEAKSEWASELARRMAILSTYDITETGYGEDLLDGGAWVYTGWFIATHPLYLVRSLSLMSSRPDLYGAARENHIVSTSNVVNSVVYGRGKVEYSTFAAPTNTIDVLRLSFDPESVKAGGKKLNKLSDLAANGYTVDSLPNGDCIIAIRHDGAKQVIIEGNDPQRVAEKPGASASLKFKGNQVRIIGTVQKDGGLADVYIDGVKQLAGIDCWTPFEARRQQVLWSKSGLENTEHEIRVVPRSEKNLRSEGTKVQINSIQWSDATGDNGFGEGGGPTGVQRMLFGYTGREDVTDSAGNKWHPASEFCVRIPGFNKDSLATWWTDPAPGEIGNTKDPELYRYGVHAYAFWVNVTVGPGGPYYARLKFANNRGFTKANCITVLINGKEVASKMDVDATAGGPGKAVDLVFNDLRPENGVIEIRFIGGDPYNGLPAEAFVQAIEVGPGNGGTGAAPKTAPPPAMEVF